MVRQGESMRCRRVAVPCRDEEYRYAVLVSGGSTLLQQVVLQAPAAPPW
jgi:hypothetical protein